MFGLWPKTLVPFAAVAVLVGCRAPLPASSELTVIADWNDVEAAAIVAVEPYETVILGSTPGDRVHTFDLLTIMDDTGTLTARRDTDAADLIPIHLTCTLGLFGDPDRERAILRDAAARLRALAGVEYRPR